MDFSSFKKPSVPRRKMVNQQVTSNKRQSVIKNDPIIVKQMKFGIDARETIQIYHKKEESGSSVDNYNNRQPCGIDLLPFEEARKLSIQRCIQSLLVHTCQCRDANCHLSSCQHMKRAVQHTKVCKIKINGNNCPVCEQLIALCFYHSKYCTHSNCVIPICSGIKQKIKMQQTQARLQQQQPLRQALQQNCLVEILRLPSSLQQKDQILQRLKMKPHN